MFSKFWLLVGAISGIFSLGAADAPRVRVIEEITAKVNGEIITRGELEKTKQQIEAEIRQQDPNISADNLAKAVNQKHADALRDQIDQLLLVQRGKDLNINVDPEITRRVADIQAQSKITDPDKFQAFIREQSGGQTLEDFKQQMKNTLLTQKVIGQEVGSKINVPQDEVQKYYEEHKKDFVREEMVFLREILISTGDKSPAAVAAAEKKAKDILVRARKGEKFAELARTYSSAATAQNDGELGAFKKGDLKPEIQEIVFKANKGYITDLIRTPEGFDIIKVEERYAAGQASLEEVKNDVMEKLYMPRMQPAVRAYLTKLRQEAFLEIRGGYVDSGAAPDKDTTWKDPATLKPETTTKEEVAARGRKRKFLKIIPRRGSGESATMPPPTVTPVPPPPAAK